jgi:hypothetical protein
MIRAAAWTLEQASQRADPARFSARSNDTRVTSLAENGIALVRAKALNLK